VPMIAAWLLLLDDGIQEGVTIDQLRGSNDVANALLLLQESTRRHQDGY